MANVKKIQQLLSEFGSTVYCVIRRDLDLYYLNDADGAFASDPVDKFISLTENSTLKGLYELSESRTAWNNGTYTVTVYTQSGGSPVITSDTPAGGGQIEIIDDSEVTLSNIQAKTDTLGGAGAITWSYTLTDDNSGDPIDGAEVWVTTDIGGSNVIATGTTNAFGIVTFYLDAGTYYIWSRHSGYTFTNPDTEVVS